MTEQHKFKANFLMSSNLNHLVESFANAQLAGNSRDAMSIIRKIAESWPRIAAMLYAIHTNENGLYNHTELLDKLPSSIANPAFANRLSLMRTDLEFRLGHRDELLLNLANGGQEQVSKEQWSSNGRHLALRAQLYLSFGMSKPLAEIISGLRTAELEKPSKAAICKAIGNLGAGFMQAKDTELLVNACYILFSDDHSWAPHSAHPSRIIFMKRLSHWVHTVQGEALNDRIDWTNQRLLLLSDETEKNEGMSKTLMWLLGKASDLSHAGALLMDRMSEQHPDSVPVQYWYHRSKVAHKIDKEPDQLAAVLQKSIKSLSTFEFATRIAYHIPFAGISRKDEGKLLQMMAASLPTSPEPRASRKDKNDPIKVVFITAYSSNHGIAHVLHRFVEHLECEDIEYALINDGAVKEDDVYQERIFGSASNVLNISTNEEPFQYSAKPSTEIQQCIDFIEEYGPDAIIHLDGYMNLTLMELMMRRLSPLNIYWIGHGGNIGLDFFDYIINDPFTADPVENDFELEKEIRLPSAFATSGAFEFDDSMSKVDFGFAEEAIIINAFNNHMKVDRTYLDAVSRVLKAVPKTVLWFNGGDSKNTVWEISNYLKSIGIDDNRYSFAGRLEPKAKHYARLHVSDFALDTFTVNMASGTLDNIWAELPVISKPGDRYTNRTAGAFNRALGLDYLNTNSVDEYVELAIELATNPEKLARLKQHLRTYKRQTSMFDGAKFAKEVAAGISAAVGRSREGLPPSNIDVPPIFDPIPKFR